MSALVEEESATAAASSESAGVTATSTDMPMQMVRCNAVSWTDEEVGLLRVWVTRRNLVTGAVTVTEEQTVQRAFHGDRCRGGAQVVLKAAAGDVARGQAQASMVASPCKTTRSTFSVISF